MIVRGSAFAALGVFALAWLLGAANARDFDASPYMHAQRLVEIGGRRMNLYCTGRGSPTVVLDTDGDDSTLGWRYVQPAVAKRTRVSSYDVAGIGFSDPAPSPRDASAFVRDLHSLLTRAGVARPFIIVGYSLSGLTARLYADRYPHDVVGMVLVDPNVPFEHKRLAAVAPALARGLAQTLPWDKMCWTAATHGALHPGTQAFTTCMYAPQGPALPPALAAIVQRQWEQPGTWKDLTFAEEASETNTSAEVVREQRSYGDMPLVVLTSDTSVLHLPIPQTQKTALGRAWRTWHDGIAALSSRGKSSVVSGSSEAIPIDRPSSVISAIEEVLDQAR